MGYEVILIYVTVLLKNNNWNSRLYFTIFFLYIDFNVTSVYGKAADNLLAVAEKRIIACH